GALPKTEAAEYRRECHELAARLSETADINAAWGSAKEAVAGAENTVVLHCHNVQFFSAAFTRLLTDPRLVDPAAEIIGSPNVQLHHTKMFIKPPEKGAPFPMHQDYPYFPHDRNTM